MATGWIRVSADVRSTCGMMPHNDRASYPRHPMAKAMREITSKRKKTDADYEAMAHHEFLASLYCNADGPYIPAKQIRGMMLKAAMRERKGQQAKAGLLCDQDAQLSYPGPRDPEELWRAGFFDQRPVVVQRARIFRTRPLFTTWEATLSFHFLDGELNQADAERFLTVGGKLLGFGDFRPEYGRFEVVQFTVRD